MENKELNTIEKIEEYQKGKQAEEDLSNSTARQKNKEIKEDMNKFLDGLK